VSASQTQNSSELRPAREFVRQTQTRLDRAMGLADDVRHQGQTRLNEVRQLIEAVDVGEAQMDELNRKLDELGPWIDKQLEGKEKSVFREYAESIGLAILFALTLRAFVVEAFKIPTGSMIPTLLIGDHLFVNKFIYGLRIPFTQTYITRFEEVERGEVIVFKFPSEEARDYLMKQPASKRQCIEMSTLDEDKDFIKRVIGVAGDTVELRDNQIIINGEPVQSLGMRKVSTGNFLYPHRIMETKRLNGHVYTVQYSGADEDFGPITVKPGHVFTMGDNRDNSSDGRCWGQVPLENVKGRAMFVWLSIGPESYRWDRIGHVIH
jgi:signal peptidase I